MLRTEGFDTAVKYPTELQQILTRNKILPKLIVFKVNTFGCASTLQGTRSSSPTPRAEGELLLQMEASGGEQWVCTDTASEFSTITKLQPEELKLSSLNPFDLGCFNDYE